MTASGFIQGPRKNSLIVGRDLCAFAHLPQSASADKSARRREAELEALRIALSGDAGYYIVLWRDSASVWTWDEAAVRAELQRAERDDLIATPRAPETLMQSPEISADGLRLAVCAHGFDGQFWRDGELVGSRWWREPPGERDWLLFAESVGGAVGHGGAPAAVTPSPLVRPWRQNDWRPQNADLIDKRVAFWVSAGLAAAVFCGAAFVAGVELTYARLKTKVAALEEEVAPVRAAHRRVMQASGELRQISAPVKGVEGLAIMSVAAAVLNSAEVKASGVELRGEKIIITLPRSYAPSADRVLRLLEDEPGIARARLAGGGASTGDLQIEADLETPT